MVKSKFEKKKLNQMSALLRINLDNQTRLYSTSTGWRFHTSLGILRKTHTLESFVDFHDYREAKLYALETC